MPLLQFKGKTAMSLTTTRFADHTVEFETSGTL
jgi:hypothetical protein